MANGRFGGNFVLSLEQKVPAAGTASRHQEPVQGSGAHRNLAPAVADTASEAGEAANRGEEDLDNVGLVVWQSAFVLGEFLLSHPPFITWQDVNVVDLGTGTGAFGSYKV